MFAFPGNNSAALFKLVRLENFKYFLISALFSIPISNHFMSSINCIFKVTLLSILFFSPNYYIWCLSLDSFDLFLNCFNGFLTGFLPLISRFVNPSFTLPQVYLCKAEFWSWYYFKNYVTSLNVHAPGIRQKSLKAFIAWPQFNFVIHLFFHTS